MSEPLIDPRHYNGPATCGWKGDAGVACPNPARWMPVLVFVAKGWCEGENTRVPAALLSLGVCDVCRGTVVGHLTEDVAPQVRDQVLNRGLRFDRVEWVQIARSV